MNRSEIKTATEVGVTKEQKGNPKTVNNDVEVLIDGKKVKAELISGGATNLADIMEEYILGGFKPRYKGDNWG